MLRTRASFGFLNSPVLQLLSAQIGQCPKGCAPKTCAPIVSVPLLHCAPNAWTPNAVPQTQCPFGQVPSFLDPFGPHLAEPLVFIYCPVVLLKMGWFENKPHLFTCNVVIKFLCQQFLATIDSDSCDAAQLRTGRSYQISSFFDKTRPKLGF